MLFKKRRPKTGAAPGTLVIPKAAAKPKIHVFDYWPDGLEEFDAETVDDLKAAFEKDSITWVDIQGFGDQQLMREIGELFGLHPLLLEDVIHVPQRPKTDVYGDQIALIVRMVTRQEDDGYDMEQVGIVLTGQYVLTFQEKHGDVLEPVRSRLRSSTAIMRKRGADYLAYAIADTIVDGYYPVLDAIGERLEVMEDVVLLDPTPELLVELHEIKSEVISLRRGIWPQRDAINQLIKSGHAAVSEDVRVYLRDTHDHCVQTSEVAEMYRELASGLMNTYLSAVANRTNEVMKVLTVMASIFIPLTFLAGVYGMNFQYMPELHMRWAYPTVWVLMLTTAGGMLVYFWRLGWIGPKASSTAQLRRTSRRR